MAAKRENKTKATSVDPKKYVESVPNEQRRKDGLALLKLYSQLTGEPPKMWGPSIVGYGKVKYRYESGREGEICAAGFSPRKASLVLYVGSALSDKSLMSRLGKYKTGKGCLYINKLEDVDLKVLQKVIEAGLQASRRGEIC